MVYLAGLADLVEVCSGMLDLDGNHLAEGGFMALILSVAGKFSHNEVIPALGRVEQ